MLFDRAFDDINAESIRYLVDERVTERNTLEYKEESYNLDSPDAKREMLKDVSSIANASGGFLILGIREDPQTGEAKAVVNIDSAKDEMDRIISSCLSNIEPRIAGLQAKVIEVNGDSVILLHIPHSLKKPHLITYRGLCQFWIRHDRQKSRMSVDEIRDSFLRTESLVEKLEDFLTKRRTYILDHIGRKQVCYVIGSAPLVLEEFMDISDQQLRDILQESPNKRYPNSQYNFDFEYGRVTPFIDGLKAQNEGEKLMLFRNGYLEGQLTFQDILTEKKQGGQISLNPYALAGYLVSFLSTYLALRNYLGIQEPFVLYLSLNNIKGTALAGSRFFEAYTEPHIEIPARQINYFENIDTIAKAVLDRVWQAFGGEGVPDFLYRDMEFQL